MRDPAKQKPIDIPKSADGSGEQLPSPGSTPSQRVIREEEEKQLKEAMDRLSSEHRQVVFLREWDKLKFEEIGRRMGRSEDAAKKLYKSAFKELRRLMNGDEQ